MGATNTEHYSEAQNQMARLAKAIGHPARIAIIEHLLKVGKCICNDIVEELPLAQPTISQHLKELKNAGLIKGNIEGNAICYCVDEAAIDTLKTYFENLIPKNRDNQNNACC
ncbi:ArsR family transcriptional regulator [Pedobacter sp. UYP30]|uniref:ArsR/SmtB family transcription factor n=1 Tax=Pedobacter sp. UYP30 TaxID=1756400 RepID=UPI003399CB98